ncbi:hypothetical protein G6F68_016347 [Rhizopus microsporus]|nr:hypothetical protein G6F68_016347 [Rhizopus microsporus]
MKYCIILACTHFGCGVIYTLGTMLLSPETAGFLILLVIFPLSITMTIFYVWTLNSITATIRDLELRKQHVKILMYKRLYRLLVFSVVAVVLIFILNMFAYSDSKNDYEELRKEMNTDIQETQELSVMLLMNLQYLN